LQPLSIRSSHITSKSMETLCRIRGYSLIGTTHTHTHTHTPSTTHTHIHTYTHTHTCAHKPPHTHIYQQTYSNTHLHTHTLRGPHEHTNTKRTLLCSFLYQTHNSYSKRECVCVGECVVW